MGLIDLVLNVDPGQIANLHGQKWSYFSEWMVNSVDHHNTVRMCRLTWICTNVTRHEIFGPAALTSFFRNRCETKIFCVQMTSLGPKILWRVTNCLHRKPYFAMIGQIFYGVFFYCLFMVQLFTLFNACKDYDTFCMKVHNFNHLLHRYNIYGMGRQCRSRSAGTSVLSD
jgi:hypothetical protein